MVPNDSTSHSKSRFLLAVFSSSDFSMGKNQHNSHNSHDHLARFRVSTVNVSLPVPLRTCYFLWMIAECPSPTKTLGRNPLKASLPLSPSRKGICPESRMWRMQPQDQTWSFFVLKLKKLMGRYLENISIGYFFHRHEPFQIVYFLFLSLVGFIMKQLPNGFGGRTAISSDTYEHSDVCAMGHPLLAIKEATPGKRSFIEVVKRSEPPESIG